MQFALKGLYTEVQINRMPDSVQRLFGNNTIDALITYKDDFASVLQIAQSTLFIRLTPGHFCKHVYLYKRDRHRSISTQQFKSWKESDISIERKQYKILNALFKNCSRSVSQQLQPDYHLMDRDNCPKQKHKHRTEPTKSPTKSYKCKDIGLNDCDSPAPLIQQAAKTPKPVRVVIELDDFSAPPKALSPLASRPPLPSCPPPVRFIRPRHQGIPPDAPPSVQNHSRSVLPHTQSTSSHSTPSEQSHHSEDQSPTESTSSRSVNSTNADDATCRHIRPRLTITPELRERRRTSISKCPESWK